MYHQDRLSLPFSVGDRRDYAHSVRGPWAPKAISASAICALLVVLDITVLIGAAAVAYVFWLVHDPYSSLTEYGLVVAFGTLLAVNIFNLARLYDVAQMHRPRQMLGRTAACWCLVAAALMAVSFLTKTSDNYSRLWALMWFGSSLTGLLATRWLLLAQTARWVAEGRLQRKVAIVGTGPLARQLAQHFAASPKGAVRVVGLFSDGETPRQPWKMRSGFGGDLDQLIQLVRLDAVDTVVVADEEAAPDKLAEIFERLREVPADVRYCPGPMALQLTRHNVSHYAGVAMLNVVDRPLSEWRYAVKEVEDRVLATLILALISPVLLTIAALVKMDSPGPALFRQKRYGYNNQLIEVFKFRTMRHDLPDTNAERLTQHNDPRITPHRRVPAPLEPGRAAPVHQRAARRDVDRRPAAACRLRQGRWPALSAGRAPTMPPATGSSRASPAGPRSTAGVARPIRSGRSRSGSSTTCTTSRTGHCGST